MLRNKNTGRTIYLILSGVLVVVFTVVGIVWGEKFPESVTETVGIVAFALLVMLGLLFAGSAIAAVFYTKSKKRSLAEQQEYLMGRKEEAEKDLDKVVKKIVFLRCFTNGCAWALLVFALGFSFVFGFGGLGYVSAFPFYLCYGALSRLFPYREKFKFEGYAQPKDYPELHALAHDAAKAVDMDGEIRIVFLNNCNAGIAKIGKTYSLQLGVLLLAVMTREELYQVLLHEFAHMTKDGNPTDKEYALFAEIAEKESTFFQTLSNILFSFPDAVYAFEYCIYRVTSSVAIEARADRVILERGDPQIAVNGMAKLGYHHLFEREMNNFIERYYAPEEPRKDTCEVLIDAFLRSIAERGAFWRELLFKEIQPRTASHPIFRRRMEALGVKDFVVTLPEHTDTYGQECQEAAKALSLTIYEENKENYPEMRKEQYIKPLEIINSYKANAQMLGAEEARIVLDALMYFNEIDEAEKLCDRIIEKTENRFATAHARFTKGRILLGRYDEQGIDCLYTAMEINKNYVEAGLSAIGEFCCITGNEERLEEYRQKALVLGQRQIDEVDHASLLTPKDRLVADEMPREMLESILAFIKKADQGVLQEVYLVRKIITDDFFSSVFILRFKEDADGEKMQQVYDKIFDHLDTHPTDWQFSLFVYNAEPVAVLKKIEKIKESLVYKAE